MKKKKHEEHENMERWLVSYADFITLLFAFFVVMYSTSSVREEGKYRAVSDSLNTAFHPIISLSSSNIRLTSAKTPGSEMFDIGLSLYRKLQDETKKFDRSDKIKVIREGQGIIIRINEGFAFETAQSEMLPEFTQALDEIAALIADAPNPIRVEGHTDNIPIKTPQFPSNWELSTARAAQIVRYFIERHAMSPDRFSVGGYAEFRPIASNETLEGRSKNRRVDLILMYEEEKTGPPLLFPALSEGAP